MKKYRLRYSGIKDFSTKKEFDNFIKKETYQILQALKFDIKNKVWVDGNLKRYPYGKITF